MSVEVHHGDCIEVMRQLAADGVQVDAVVTDPPAGIGFMGKEWDKDRGGRTAWCAWMQDAARLALELAKPGAHALVWALPRTSHWTATAWEDAGWEVRDRIAHLFGTGFPKSRNLDGGLGTALKPACEDWWLLRKPLVDAVSENVKAHGTGALNIDACRVGDGARGRWPANLTHDGSDEVMEAFAAFGEKPSRPGKTASGSSTGITITGLKANKPPPIDYIAADDTGTAARFFYNSKASKADRCGSRHPTVKPISLVRYLCRLITPPGGLVLDPFAGSGTIGEAAINECFRAVLIEREAEYVEDIKRRIAVSTERKRDLQTSLL